MNATEKEDEVYQSHYFTQEYRTQDVMSASPVRLVIMAYDVAIRACRQQDFERATRAITLLRDALNFDYAEVAAGLFRLYQWCLECLRAGDYQSALNVLVELREAWAEAEKKISATPTPGDPLVVRTMVPQYASA